MPLTRFICPDGETIELSDCLEKCRMAERCLTLPTLLTLVAGQREWNGTPSTTQLINGTMLEYLKATESYSVDPRSRAFALLGTAHHIKLAQPKGPWMAELALKSDEVTGILDLLEPDPSKEGSFILTDYKTFGSYKVAKCLGSVGKKQNHPTDVYKRGGSWGAVGTPKQITVFHKDPDRVEMVEEELQLNNYRVMLLDSVGLNVSSMRLQVTVRDGGTIVAKERGVTETIYLIPVKRRNDGEVRTYFADKANRLCSAINDGVAPEPCNDFEAWAGRRCVDYCDVATFCPRGKREKFIAKE